MASKPKRKDPVVQMPKQVQALVARNLVALRSTSKAAA